MAWIRRQPHSRKRDVFHLDVDDVARLLGLEQLDDLLRRQDDGRLGDVDDHPNSRKRRLKILEKTNEL